VNTRRAISRELALLVFSQMAKNTEKWQSKDITEIIEKTVETLTGEAESNLQDAVRELSKVREYIVNYEIDHTDNLERPVDAFIIPVALPMTSDMTGRIDMLLEAAEKIYSSMDVVQIAAMAERDIVKDYAVALVSKYNENKENVNNLIKTYAKDWDVDRLQKIDSNVLRIAITEILYFDEVPAKVSIDEAVELAKKYGTEESSAFVNGVLREVYESTKIS